jgi:ATP-dependent DNA helicase RecG
MSKVAKESQTLEWKQSLAETDEVVKTAAAFANTAGGRVLIGVSHEGKALGVQVGKGTLEKLVNRFKQRTDPILHPKVSVKKMNGKDVIVVEVRESPDHLTLAFGKPYKRVGRSTVGMAKDEYERLILEKHKAKLYFDEQVCKGAKISDISKEKLLSFVKKAKQQRGLSIDAKLPVTDILKKLKLVKGGKLTNAAILLFGKDTQAFFLQAELKLIRFKGTDVTGPMLDFKTLGGDAITLLEKAESSIPPMPSGKLWPMPWHTKTMPARVRCR